MVACVQCGGERRCTPHCSVRLERKQATGRKISEGMKRSWATRGCRNDPERAWRNFASHAVKKAIQLGFLPRLDGSHLCVDCGAVATQYEHRDYTRVIDVEPVCASCNLRRPRAPMPQARQFPQVRNKP